MTKKPLLLMLPIALLASCTTPTDDPFPSTGDSTSPSSSSILMTQAVMGMDMLSSIAPSTNAKARAMTPTEEQTLATELLGYVAEFDNIIGYSPSEIKEQTSDNPDYQYLYTLSLEGDVYSLYFNKTDERYEVDYDDHEQEEETTYRFDGLAIKDGVTFDFTGFYTQEKEGREVETELEFNFLVDRNNYVSFTQEIEDGENEYEITLVENGRRVMQKEFEIELGRNGTIEIGFEITENGTNKEVELTKTTRNGQTVFLIEYEQKGEEFAIVKVEERETGTVLVLTFAGSTNTYEMAI